VGVGLPRCSPHEEPVQDICARPQRDRAHCRESMLFPIRIGVPMCAPLLRVGE